MSGVAENGGHNLAGLDVSGGGEANCDGDGMVDASAGDDADADAAQDLGTNTGHMLCLSLPG